MKSVSFITHIIIVLLVLNCQVLPVVLGEFLSENKVSTHNGDLQDNEHLKNANNNSDAIISEPHSGRICSKERQITEISPWFLNIPLLPVIVATSNSIPEGPCKRQLRLYLNHLKNGTLWATEMFDSSAKYPYGLFDGFTRHLGSFDQCERIQTRIINNDDGKIEEIHSRYCLVDVKFKEKDEPKNFTGQYEIFFDPHVSAWEAIREKGDFRRYRRYFLQMALCFPAKCQTEDIVTALKQPLDEFGSKYNIQIEASISPLYCSLDPKETQKFSNYDIIFYFIFLLMLTIVIISTVIDMKNDKNKEPSLLLCFSARKNFNDIFRVNYSHRGFDSIHFFRVLVTALVIIGHRQVQYMYSGTISGSYLEWVLSHYIFGVLHNASLVVDGFFGLGGLLLSFSLLNYWNERQSFNFLVIIFKRLMRLLPLYMFVTFAYATLLHRFGSGPFWESTMGFTRDSCSSYWWTNLFFINNYFGGNKKCMIQTWYLAVDFQCYIIGLLLIRAFYKLPRKFGYTFLGCALSVSAAIPYYFTLKHNLNAFVRIVPVSRRVEEIDYFLNYYIKTHFRVSSYITGLIFGTFLHDYENANWRLSKVWSKLLFNVAIVISLITMWIATFFANPNWRRTYLQRALYASLHRPIFTFCICSIPLLLTIGDGLDTYYNILAAKWLQPVSRITYAIYLVNFVMFHYEIGTTKTTFTFSFYNSIKYFVADIIYSVCLALFVVLVVEFPIKNLITVLLKRRTQKGSTDTEKKTK